MFNNSSSVLVVGDVMLDRYINGDSNRISPEAPVPVVKVAQVEDRAGGAANVALNVASLGLQVTIMGIVGHDEEAKALRASLIKGNVREHLVALHSIPTITKTRIISRHQQLLRLDNEESIFDVDLQELTETFLFHLDNYDVVILSDYAKGTLKDVEHYIRAATEKNIPILIDPKGSCFTKYRGATLLTPNLSEFEAVVGKCLDETTLISKAQQLLMELSLDALLITRSEKGMTLVQRNAATINYPAKAKDVFDVTGAGDTVIATLASCLAIGLPIEESTCLANEAAGIVVGKFGTSTVSQEELFAKQNIGIDSVSFEGSDALIAIRELQAAGKKIVMTNGCFDILHPGHIQYLVEAKSLGDILVVAVNSDDSVRRLKGNGRPINDLNHRVAILKALASVDIVVTFETDTPAILIGEILPDVLVKGGDYEIEEIAGGDRVLAHGGTVKTLIFKDGFSTSNIIKKIQDGILQ